MIEATGNLGVKVKKWSNLRGNLGEFYERIVLRHLEFKRSDDSLNKLEQFLKEVNGKHYSFKPKHLMKRNTINTKNVSAN